MSGDRILPEYEFGQDIGEAVRQAIGAASVCWDPMDATGVFMEGRANQIADELTGIITKYAQAYPDGQITKPAEPAEVSSQKIAMVTYAAGVRQVIGEAEIAGDQVIARIPLASLELGVARALRAEAAKGFSLSKKEINLKPPQMVTGILFPTDLKFQIDGSDQ